MLIQLIGFLILIIGVLGFWGGLASLFDFANPLGQITLALYNMTLLFLSDFASLIFWFIIILLGLALMSPKERGYSSILRRRYRW